ncbi:hypothetical protein CJD36_011060 [Flavipsychrobacter stenotrophus]|uniref:Uncharacterized protein n=1 Tax=Flavipsychrobacter stenotrophus TaxID=2077091 RepID=A0A2S7SUW4_9BACT|nr:hypothetical protein [Flavipsychrobacter stenotrophus]PQJ10508.1 hypothetical protein CJD36_011060 [Flavipsychrobacter stenotrophus]
MIDGGKITAILSNFVDWQGQVGIEISATFNVATGEQIERVYNNGMTKVRAYTGSFERYNLKVIETAEFKNGTEVKTYVLIITGSLHKNHFSGKNYQRFTFWDLQIEIQHLCHSLQLRAENLIIQNLEIGLNIALPWDASKFIHHCVLFHGTSPFRSYTPDKNGVIIGRVAMHSHYSVKCYDKGLQNNLSSPLMRFEVRCIKMQYLSKYNILTLADLTDRDKMRSLVSILSTAWNNVLVSDRDVDTNLPSLSVADRALLVNGRHRRFWEQLHACNRSLFNRRRIKFKELNRKHSATNAHQNISKLIIEEWDSLFLDGTFLPVAKIGSDDGRENIPTIKIKSKSVLNHILKQPSIPAPITPLKSITPISGNEGRIAEKDNINQDKIEVEEAIDIDTPEVLENLTTEQCLQENQEHDNRAPIELTAKAINTAAPIRQEQVSATLEKQGRQAMMQRLKTTLRLVAITLKRLLLRHGK